MTGVEAGIKSVYEAARKMRADHPGERFWSVLSRWLHETARSAEGGGGWVGNLPLQTALAYLDGTAAAAEVKAGEAVTIILRGTVTGHEDHWASTGNEGCILSEGEAVPVITVDYGGCCEAALSLGAEGLTVVQGHAEAADVEKIAARGEST